MLKISKSGYKNFCWTKSKHQCIDDILNQIWFVAGLKERKRLNTLWRKVTTKLYFYTSKFFIKSTFRVGASKLTSKILTHSCCCCWKLSKYLSVVGPEGAQSVCDARSCNGGFPTMLASFLLMVWKQRKMEMEVFGYAFFLHMVKERKVWYKCGLWRCFPMQSSVIGMSRYLTVTMCGKACPCPDSVVVTLFWIGKFNQIHQNLGHLKGILHYQK